MAGKKWLQGKYTIKNPEKYAGTKTPSYRSSWEFAFMQFCDNHPNIVSWASEAIQIPYRNPLTGRNTIYVPDFLVVYLDNDGTTRTELIEIKPSSQTTLESAGKNRQNQAAVAVNMAKWQAANAWARRAGITFRVVTESDIFKNTKSRK